MAGSEEIQSQHGVPVVSQLWGYPLGLCCSSSLVIGADGVLLQDRVGFWPSPSSIPLQSRSGGSIAVPVMVYTGSPAHPVSGMDPGAVGYYRFRRAWDNAKNTIFVLYIIYSKQTHTTPGPEVGARKKCLHVLLVILSPRTCQAVPCRARLQATLSFLQDRPLAFQCHQGPTATEWPQIGPERQEHARVPNTSKHQSELQHAIFHALPNFGWHGATAN